MSRLTSRNFKMRLAVTVSLPVIAAWSAGGGARAQSAPAASAPQAGLEEVVVTARKRAETLLTTPVAITAFTAESLQQRNIKTLEDVAAYTPALVLNHGLSSTNDRSTQLFILRGMRPVDTTATTTTLFIDGAPVLQGFVPGVDQVERVEIIKGPQSAYFGRQTFAGAINLVTRDPSNTYKARIDGLAASDNWTDFRGTIEGPLIKDKLTFRLSARDFRRDGQYDNVSVPGETFGDQSSRDVSLTLLARPVEGLTVKAFGVYFEDEDGPTTVGKVNRNFYNCNAGVTPNGPFNYYCGDLPSSFPSRLIGNNTQIDPAFRSLAIDNATGKWRPIFSKNLGLDHGGLQRHAYHGNLNIDYVIPGTGFTLTSVTAGDINKVANIADYGNAPDTIANRFLVLKQQLNSDYSQELRLSSDQAKRLRYSIGVNYAWAKNIITTVGSAPTLGGVLNLFSPNPSYAKTAAAFGTVAFDFTSQLTLNLEGRYQQDKREVYTRSFPASGGFTDTLSVSGKDTNFLPRVILQYKFAPEQQVYATYAKSKNPGLFNSQFLSLSPAALNYLSRTYGITTGVSTKPESIDYYEVGYKARLWDGRAQFVADVYYGKWTDQLISQQLVLPVFVNGVQTAALTTITPYTNLGATDVSGAEFELTVALMQNLIVNAAGSMNDTNIRAYASTPATALTGKTNFSGNELPNSSKWNFTMGAEYTRALRDGLDLYVRGDYIYKSGLWDSIANLAKTRASNVVNLKAGVRAGKYGLEGFVDNVFDDKAYTSIEQNVDVLSPGFADRALNLGLPVLRRFGLRAHYDF